MMTAAHESQLGRWLLQLPNGPARGIYQMEPETERDIWINYLRFRSSQAAQIIDLCGVEGADPEQLQYNPIYNTILARIKYLRRPGALPQAHDIIAMAEYAKLNFNSPGGKATPEEYMLDYRRLVLD